MHLAGTRCQTQCLWLSNQACLLQLASVQDANGQLV